MLRRVCLTLPAVLSAWLIPVATSSADAQVFMRPAAVAVYSGGFGYSVHPFDDGYDPPFGYGEYAVYGPWAYRGYGGCYVGTRKVRTSRGWQFRPVRICD